MVNAPTDSAIRSAASAIRDASALLITAGAGMGVDSGLPDFRGPEGFWQAYPPYRRLGLRFEQLANPQHFETDPHLAWGFYGHRLHLYRATRPHAGFAILKSWTASKPRGGFIFTSNVDGQFAAAGFPTDCIVECHGSIHHLQCALPCDGDIWPADGIEVQVDPQTMRAVDPLPRCPRCGAVARPNILMFGDMHWISTRTDEADAGYDRWRNHIPSGELCVIECGAGTGIPTVRLESERLARRFDGTLIRINVREAQVAQGNVSISLGASEALTRIAAALSD